MKMWFPNWAQWVAMWAALILAGFLAGNPFGNGTEWAGMVFVIIAAIFIVWMLEGRRRKPNQNE